jgi:hypothetical protein
MPAIVSSNALAPRLETSIIGVRIISFVSSH